MRIPQIEPVTALSKDYKTVFAKLQNGPVVLAMRSRPAAVLLSIKDYQDMATRLQRFELLAEARRNLAKAESDPSSVTTHEELERLLAANAAANVDARLY